MKAFLLCVVCLALVGCTPEASVAPTGGSTGFGSCPDEGEELETAMLFIEHNATDQDTGVHGNFGGEAWTQLCIFDPEENLILAVATEGPFQRLGVADLFFESREPPAEEYSIDDLESDFPEGEYRIGVAGHDGIARVATATFSHDIPAAPIILSPTLSDNEDAAADFEVEASDFVVSWEQVTETIDGNPAQITAYEVIITKVDHDDPHGFSRPVYDVHLGPESTSLAVPEGFFEPATLYELELLAIETTGNQTITLGFFISS